MLFYAFSVAFFFRKVNLGKNQDEAIASSCLALPHAIYGPATLGNRGGAEDSADFPPT